MLPPACINKIDNDGFLVSSEPWFDWYYKPKHISLNEATNNFSQLFEEIIKEQCIDKKLFYLFLAVWIVVVKLWR